jgi:hypothetical protein
MKTDVIATAATVAMYADRPCRRVGRANTVVPLAGLERRARLKAAFDGEGGHVVDWILHRWKRFGHDRLYAETPDGTRLGYLDMKTHELHPTEPTDLSLLSAAVAAYLRMPAPEAPHHAAERSSELADAAAPPAERYTPRHGIADWIDLGAPPPGADPPPKR